MPPNFSHPVSFSRSRFSLARIFFFSARLFVFGAIFFSARLGQVTADQYYCSGMEHMVIAGGGGVGGGGGNPIYGLYKSTCRGIEYGF